MANTNLVIVDLDDTLWRWCDTWRAGYTEFNNVLANYGVPENQAIDAWAQMYLRVKGAVIEFPPMPGDMAEVGVPTSIAVQAYQDALPASRKARDEALIVFPTVVDTLKELADSGITVVAHTDSPATAAAHRLHTSGMDGSVSELYAAPRFDDFGDSLDLVDTKHTHVRGWKPKPNTTVIEAILQAHKVDPSHAAYVGDSLRRDMSMARNAGLNPVWARYGSDYEVRTEVIQILHKVQRHVPFPAEDYAATPTDTEYATLEQFSDLLDIVR